MASTPVEVLIGVDGQAGLMLTLYPLGGDTPANGGGDTLTEQANRHGTYRAIVDEALAGVFEAYVLDADADVFFYGFLYLEDTTDVWTVADDLASARARVGTGGITAAALSNDAVTEIQAGLMTIDLFSSSIGATVIPAIDALGDEVAAIRTKTDVLPAIMAGEAGGVFIAGANAATSIAGLTTSITGNLSGSVGAVATGGISAASFATSAIDANALSADAVAELVAGINGQGARTVTFTVDDGTDPLEGARVRLTKGAETYLQTTDVSGQCTFNVNDGTWLVAITLVGYEFSGESLVVDEDKTITYSLAPYTISPPTAPNLTTGYVLCLGIDGLPEAGVTIHAQMTSGPGSGGYALDTDTITMTSDDDGLAQYSGFVRGAAYKFRRGNSTWWTSPQVAPSTPTWSLIEIIGAP